MITLLVLQDVLIITTEIRLSGLIPQYFYLLGTLMVGLLVEVLDELFPRDEPINLRP